MQSINYNVGPTVYNKQAKGRGMKLRRRQPFLEKLDVATTKKDCGVYMFEGFLSKKEAKNAFDLLVDDTNFPWDTRPELNGQPLTQKSCEHDLIESAKEQKKKEGRTKYPSNLKGLLKLGEICALIERDFDVEVSFVFCNRFPNPAQQPDWCKNEYGEHICVLTLGSKRRIEVRNNETEQIETMTPSAGDLYVMPLKINDTHTQRVCSANEMKSGANEDALLSFVFFFKAPKYAKEFRPSMNEEMMEFMEGILA
jgi:hypothetical protein